MLRIDIAKAQQKVLDRIKRSPKDWFQQQLFVKINAKWFREFMAYDPAGDLSPKNRSCFFSQLHLQFCSPSLRMLLELALPL